MGRVREIVNAILGRGYDAADNGRLNDAWRVSNQTPHDSDTGSRDCLRARARDLERNSAVVSALLSAMERNVVGWGLQLQARTGNDAADDQIEAAFAKWSRAGNCDSEKRMSFAEICRAIVRRKTVDGGVLILLRADRDRDVPFCLQLVEVDALSGYEQSPKYKNDRIVDGVEIDPRGRAVGYWVRVDVPGDISLPLADSVFVPAKDAIFYFTPKRPMQIREISELAPLISPVRDIGSYMEAVSVKERVAACFAVFIKRAANVAQIGRSATKNRDAQSKYPQKIATPGMVTELEPGDDVASVLPPNQGSAAAEFVRLQERMVAAGMGLSYEALSRDMSQVNYSSARQAILEDGATVEIWQRSLIEHVLSEVYEGFLDAAVLSGRVVIPDYWRNREAYQRHEWALPARPWIDPLKEANANKIALETGQKTYREIVGSNGSDWREQMRQIAEERDFAEKLGIDFGGKHNA